MTNKSALYNLSIICIEKISVKIDWEKIFKK